MNLWIRRQFNEHYDKEYNLIICPNRLSVHRVYGFSPYEDVGYEILGDDTSLGLYYYEDKAIQVFEKIISEMEKNSNDFRVYQMPSDD